MHRWQLVFICDQFYVLIPSDVLLGQVGELCEGLSIDSHVDHIVIFSELAHAFPHPLAITVATKAHHRFETSPRRVSKWRSDLFRLVWQIVAEEIVLFDGEGIYSVVLFEVVVVAEQGSLPLRPRQTSDAFFVPDRIGNVLREILKRCILTHLLELLCLLDNWLGLWEEAELADSLVGDSLLREVPRVIDAG